jgi:hypothetical protein
MSTARRHEWPRRAIPFVIPDGRADDAGNTVTVAMKLVGVYLAGGTRRRHPSSNPPGALAAHR